MPTYVYRNLKTGQTFELKQSMRDEALTQHPETGEPIKRLVSAPAIAFKGSGFYANDSRSSGAGGHAKAGADTTATSESASSDKASSEKASADKSTSDKVTSDKSNSDKSTSAPSAKTDAPSKAPATSSTAGSAPSGGRGE